MLLKEVLLKNSQKSQVFSEDFSEIFKNTFFTRQLLATVFETLWFFRKTNFFISNQGQALILKVTCIFNIFRAQSCLTVT